MLQCRLIVDEPGSGAWNMAVDEALLESAANDSVCTLRFYGWSEPTLSLGYFQCCADRNLHISSRACPLVRRLSGGGAILHDDELTYSFAAPPNFRPSMHAQSLYDVFHQSLVEVLSAWGVQARLYEHSSEFSADQEPFLCFQRRSSGDVVVADSPTGSIKIAGSAQRRRRGAILQHGSLLFRASPLAPELPGLKSVMDCALPARQDILMAWSATLESKLGLCPATGGLSPREKARTSALVAEKYVSANWNERK